MKHSEKIMKLVSQAYEIVYMDDLAFVVNIAREFAISNSGMDVADFVHAACKPEHVFAAAWDAFVSQLESDEQAEGCEEEFSDWRRRAKQMIVDLDAAGASHTVGNARNVFLNPKQFMKK